MGDHESRPQQKRTVGNLEYEQHGSDRAQYAAKLLDELAKDLRRSIGKASRWVAGLPGNSGGSRGRNAAACYFS